MSADAPLVSIGLPTRNGERYIRESIDSLLAQDHPRLELVISDNASTDGTPAILATYAGRDDRVRVVRQPALIGASANFNFLVQATSGPYFMWAADDDRWEPSYVTACLRALSERPEAVMACAGVRFIDERGRPLEMDYSLYDNPDLGMSSPAKRTRRLLGRAGWYACYGLARRTALARTSLFRDVYGPDVVLTLELSMLGPIVRVPEVLHWYRQQQDRTEADRAASVGPGAARAQVVAAPATHLVESLWSTVSRAPLPAATRVRVRLEILRAAFVAETPLHAKTRLELPRRSAQALRDRRPARALLFVGLRALSAMGDLVARARRRISVT